MARYRRRRHHRPARRGVILLVVLSILVLFTLIAVTFVMVSTQHKRALLQEVKAARYDDSASELLHLACMQVIRGTDNPYSAVGRHSLLEDFYGTDGVEGIVTSLPGGMMSGSLMFLDSSATGGVSTVPGYYNGRVLSMLSGQAGGKSTRIVGYAVNLSSDALADTDFTPILAEDQARILTLPFEGMVLNAAGTAWVTTTAPAIGDLFLINGRPFNGTGFGYNPSTGYVNAADSAGREYALLPFPPNPFDGTTYTAFVNGPDGTAGTADDNSFQDNGDEDYDVPDYHNMIVAGRMLNRSNSTWNVFLPSLVRPELVNYWYQRLSAPMSGFDLTDPAVLQEALRRVYPRPLQMPLPNGHPNFTGSNTALSLLDFWADAGSPGDGILDVMNKLPWDVDNDGDGIPDSVWVDLGMPVQTAPDGRQYKPLFAIMVLDQDGNLNLNAHSNVYHYDASDLSLPYVAGESYSGPYALASGATPANVDLPRGIGVGVADVNLAPIMPSNPYNGTLWPNPPLTGTINELWQLLHGRPPLDNTGTLNDIPPIPGRYGEAHLLYGSLWPMPGLTSTTVVHDGWDGVSGTYDDLWDGDDNLPAAPMSRTADGSCRGFSGNSYAEGFFFDLALGYNGSPTDLDSNGSVALDIRGQPYTNGMGAINPGPDATFGTADDRPEAVDDPYELDLSQDAARGAGNSSAETVTIDQPFTAGELEYLLRYFDIDARELPNRIGQLAPALVSDPFTRGEVTTHSFDLPSPSIQAPPELNTYRLANGLSGLGPNLHITDLLVGKLQLAGVPTASINTEVAKMLAPDLTNGLRLDINRPLGNGYDDDGDGSVDDPDEADPAISGGAVETLWTGSAAGAIAFDGGMGVVAADSMLNRQLLARHLFVMLMLLKDSGYIHPTFEAGITAAEKEELTARRLAQWAINAVEFRDRDSIMSSFEYDWQPFEDGGGLTDVDGDGLTDAWEVDGIVGFGSADDNNLTDHPDRRVVWGCEYPDLVIMETVAGHDRRVTDVATDNGPMATTADMDGDGNPDDPSFDQERIPQGWCYFELYCTRNPNNPALQADLYNPAGQLDLGKLAPANTAGDQYPVHRLVITESGLDNDTTDSDGNDKDNIRARIEARPDSATMQPERFNILDATEPAVGIERIVWFSTTAPTTTTVDENKIYYNRASGPAVLLPPGQYAVVGPRRETTGGGTDNIGVVGWESDSGQDEPQKFHLGDSSAGPAFTFTDNNAGADYTYPSAATKAALGIAVAGEHDDGRDIGISASEPVFSDGSYYPDPTETTTDPHDNTIWEDRYDADPSTMGVLEAFDDPIEGPGDYLATSRGGDALTTSTTIGYKTVLLQRLANPQWAWNPEPDDPVHGGVHDTALPANPYITLDFSEIDLTVYNGEYRPPATSAPPAQLPDPDDPTPTDADINFGSRQRGVGTNNAERRGPSQNIIWTPDNRDPWVVTGSDYTYTEQVDHEFRWLLDNTLGYLNLPFQEDLAGSTAPPTATYYGDTTADPYAYTDPWDGAKTTHQGDPLNPFPWLVWNNRPYASPMELLLVPHSGPQKLLYEFAVRRASYDDHYNDVKDTNSDGTPDEGYPYGHLLNFFHSSDNNPANDPTAINDPPSATTAHSNYHRLLEFVRVPSRFSGTEEMLNPVLTAANALPFRPPFNRISRFRDPGLVNVNAVFGDSTVWEGVMNGYPGASVLFDQMGKSRRGYGTDPLNMLEFNNNSPTIFANPFRSYMGEYNVPIDALRYRNVDTGGTRRDLVESGFLRPDPDDTARPLFAAAGGNTTLDPGTPFTRLSEVYRDADRNVAFRYQPLQKLSNVLTTRSNVYAIWVTVGFFEVNRTTANAVHPDGYTLGAELGSDSGEINRHRAFYLFDRTIPVAFQRGQNHNVERGLLVRRVIE